MTGGVEGFSFLHVQTSSVYHPAPYSVVTEHSFFWSKVTSQR